MRNSFTTALDVARTATDRLPDELRQARVRRNGRRAAAMHNLEVPFEAGSGPSQIEAIRGKRFIS